MPTEQDVWETAAALYLSLGLFRRQLRQSQLHQGQLHQSQLHQGQLLQGQLVQGQLQQGQLQQGQLQQGQLQQGQLQQAPAEGGLSLPESSALRRLERDGAATVTALARAEQISVQSMGATLGALEARGLIKRQSDPADGRRAVMSITEAGLSALSDKRNARIAQVARALANGFTPEELDQLRAAAPLIERLAESV